MPRYNYSLTREISEDFRLLSPPVCSTCGRTIQRIMAEAPWAAWMAGKRDLA